MQLWHIIAISSHWWKCQNTCSRMPCLSRVEASKSSIPQLGATTHFDLKFLGGLFTPNLTISVVSDVTLPVIQLEACQQQNFLQFAIKMRTIAKVLRYLLFVFNLSIVVFALSHNAIWGPSLHRAHNGVLLCKLQVTPLHYACLQATRKLQIYLKNNSDLITLCPSKMNRLFCKASYS